MDPEDRDPDISDERGDPFIAFVEWSEEADEEAFVDL